jgi:pimeloyl-ACP methyl ester carboxylesterase
MFDIHALTRRARPRETLLCLHASGASGRQWAPYAAAWGERFEVVAPELLGYAGDAAWPRGTPASLDDEALALAPLLDARGVHLVGHSYGGAVALQLALRWPERVRSLTLYEPVRFALLLRDAATVPAGETIVGVGRRIGFEVLSGALHAAARRFVDYWSGDGSWDRLDPARRDRLAARMPKVQAEFEALFADRVPAAAYTRLPMPVHLLGGSRSPLPARQVLDLLATQLPQARHSRLDGLGHLGPVEDPQRVLDAIGADLQRPALALAA